MSLLIKALDHLDKSKQAEKNKQPTGEYVADEALMLELLPVETAQPTALEQLVEPSIEEKLAFADAVETAVAENKTAAKVLTLEEEAGLTGIAFATSKYAKPKHGAAKPSVDIAAEKLAPQMGTLKNVLTDAPQNASVKNTFAGQIKTPAGFQSVVTERNQKAAAKVFEANKMVKAPNSKSVLFFLGVAGALLLWLGMQGYSYFKTLSAPDVVLLKPSTPIQPQVVAPQVVVTAPTELAVVAPAVQSSQSQPALIDAQTNNQAKVNNKTNTSAFTHKAAAKPSVFEDVIEAEPKKPRAKKTISTNNEPYIGDEDAANTAPVAGNAKHKPLTLISKAPSLGVDPTLLAAYQAFTRGENAAAQQQYRQVLQRDVHNVDALLGMAAIAQRQSREADAAGWYQKVLEIEPKNTIALSGIAGAGLQVSNDPIGAESRIKNMLAQQPDAAQLHAALGNVYAEQSQWPSAQEAYFNASRLAPNNADYTFNLAISLDQMGKSNLALKQYQRALELLNKSGANSPDRATLEARIAALQ